jgi:hypothetical protein
MVKLAKWILGKILLYAAIFGFFYLLGDSLGLVPQSVKNFVSGTIAFIQGNIVLLAFCFCFSIFCWMVVRLGTRKGKEEKE